MWHVCDFPRTTVVKSIGVLHDLLELLERQGKCQIRYTTNAKREKLAGENVPG